MDPRVLPREYYLNSAIDLAPDMLGKMLCRRTGDRIIRHRITETEVYCGEEDTACHASRGRTKRTWLMYEMGGRAYVYHCYMFNLLTVITGPEGHPEGVLIRGVDGFDGPGKVGREYGLELSMYGSEMSPDGGLWLEDDGVRPAFEAYPRIGIGYASREDRERPWRFRSKGDTPRALG